MAQQLLGGFVGCNSAKGTALLVCARGEKSLDIQTCHESGSGNGAELIVDNRLDAACKDCLMPLCPN